MNSIYCFYYFRIHICGKDWLLDYFVRSSTFARLHNVHIAIVCSDQWYCFTFIFYLSHHIRTMPKQTLKKANKRSTHLDSRAKRAEQGKLIYKIDCSIPCSDELIDAETMKKFEAYITENLKINGKTGQLGNKVKISLNENQILITKFQVCYCRLFLDFSFPFFFSLFLVISKTCY